LDQNGDGITDYMYLVNSDHGGDAIYFWRGEGDGQLTYDPKFLDPQFPIGIDAQTAIAGATSADGGVDLWLVGTSFELLNLVRYHLDASGQLGAPDVVTLDGIEDVHDYHAIHLADVNGDGYVDAMVGSVDLTVGAGSYRRPRFHLVTQTPTSLASPIAVAVE